MSKHSFFAGVVAALGVGAVLGYQICNVVRRNRENKSDSDFHITAVKAGTVYLVGAGPASVELLTVKAYSLLAQADVVVTDELVGEGVIQLIPDRCEVILVGKRGGKNSSVPQTDINSVLVSQSKMGRVVVRLKGGDPLVFGRVFDEILALEAEGCPYQIVPGVTSALAAPAAAGIPVTHKTLSRNFAVVTGHLPDQLDWQCLGRMDTLLILMGTRKLSQICAELIVAGRPSSFPVAIVKWASAGTELQEVVVATLGSIEAVVSGRAMSPAVLVVGEVAKFGKSSWN